MTKFSPPFGRLLTPNVVVLIVTCLVLVIILHTSEALFPSRDALSNLDGLNGFSITGLSNTFTAKRWLALGDINCDGIDDIAIVESSSFELANLYVKFGTTASASSSFDVTSDFSDDGSNGFMIQGRFSQLLSLSLSQKYAHPDFNVQCQDLIIADEVFNNDSGVVFIVKARPSVSPSRFASKILDLDDQTDPLIHQISGDGIAVSYFGRFATTVDFNGDGVLDYAFDHRYAVTVMFGPISFPRTSTFMELAQMHKVVTFQTNYAANPVVLRRKRGGESSAEDLCFYEDELFGNNQFRCIFGSKDWNSTAKVAASSTLMPGFTPLQSNQHFFASNASQSLTGIDFNLDQIDDIAVFGSTGFAPGVKVHLGSPDLSSTSEPTAFSFPLLGQYYGVPPFGLTTPASGYLGSGSIDGETDSFKLPLIIGGNFDYKPLGHLNHIYGIYGGSQVSGFNLTSGQSVVNSCTHFVLDPPTSTTSGVFFGSESGIGDVNGDGFADIIVRDAETIYVLFGYDLGPKWIPSVESMEYTYNHSTPLLDLGKISFAQCTTIVVEIIAGAQVEDYIRLVSEFTECPTVVDEHKLTITCSVDQSINKNSLSLVFQSVEAKPLKHDITIAIKYFHAGSEDRLITLTQSINVTIPGALDSFN